MVAGYGEGMATLVGAGEKHGPRNRYTFVGDGGGAKINK